MSENFTKLFASITDSSVWMEDSDTRIVWVTLLAMADANGYVGSSIPGIAARAHVSLDVTERALAKFQAPDKYSRSKAHEGRRIAEVDRGWKLLNYRSFRENQSSPPPPTPESDSKGKVYFIRCGDTVKIGFSKNPWARLNALKGVTPIEPVLIGSVAGTMEDAKSTVLKLAASRVNREWFALTPEVISHLESALGSDAVAATGSYHGFGSSTTGQLQQEAEGEGEEEVEEEQDRSTLPRGSESARAEPVATEPDPPVEWVAHDARADNVGQAEPGDESELDRGEREHREIRAFVRRGFSRRWEAAKQPGLWPQFADPGVDKLTDWVASLPGDRAEQLASLDLTLDNFFADTWVRARHFQIGHLANLPTKYLDPRQVPQRSASGYAPRQARASPGTTAEDHAYAAPLAEQFAQFGGKKS
jgi:hypothetical protein